MFKISLQAYNAPRDDKSRANCCLRGGDSVQRSENKRDRHLESSPSFWHLISLIVGAIGIGFAPIFVRLSNVGPFATGFWRVALALPILILLSAT